MSIADAYRQLAEEFTFKAKTQADPHMRIEYEVLAKNYCLLAEQAEKNSRTDIVYEAKPQPSDRE